MYKTGSSLRLVARVFLLCRVSRGLRRDTYIHTPSVGNRIARIFTIILVKLHPHGLKYINVCGTWKDKWIIFIFRKIQLNASSLTMYPAELHSPSFLCVPEVQWRNHLLLGQDLGAWRVLDLDILTSLKWTHKFNLNVLWEEKYIQNFGLVLQVQRKQVPKNLWMPVKWERREKNIYPSFPKYVLVSNSDSWKWAC